MTDENGTVEPFVHVGHLARQIMERLEANKDKQFVIPGMEGPTVTMRLSDYDAMRDRIKELTNALVAIHRLSREGAAWKLRATESRRIASEALRGHD